MFAYRLGPTRTAQLIAVLHLAAAGLLLFGPGVLLLGSLAMAGVPARVLGLFAHRFSLEAGRDGAAWPSGVTWRGSDHIGIPRSSSVVFREAFGCANLAERFS